MSLPTLPAEARRILGLARRDKPAARAAFSDLSPEAQVELICRSPLNRRRELLDLAGEPEKLIPLLPEAELCFTVKELGVSDAAWILELATPEQIVAAVDLDAWNADTLDTVALGNWLEVLAEAGDPALLRAAQALDAELLVLELRSRIEVWLKPPNDDQDWQPPAQSRTLEGQFYWRPLHEGDDVAALTRLMHALFSGDYWLYFRLMQGAIWELDEETAVWAERWRDGRLEDLGFPPRSQAVLALYSHLPPEQLGDLPADAHALDTETGRLPVLQPELPVAPDARLLVFRAAAELDSDRRSTFLYALLGLSNSVAVADRMPLGDAESSPRAIERAAELASSGLEHLAEAHGLDPTEVLRRTPLARLFRVGANLRGELPPEEPAETSAAAE